MNASIINLTAEPVGEGRERACYVHPDDASKLIKIPKSEVDTQTRREVDFYQRLQKRKMDDFSHIPACYGTVMTNLGKGILVDLVQDADGTISKDMRWHLNHGVSIQTLEPYLEQLKQYLLKNLVIINHDLVLGNLLLQKLSAGESRLVIIDGLGDVVKLQWLNHFPSHVRAKIERRWQRFIKHIYAGPEIGQYLDDSYRDAESPAEKG